MGRGRAGCKVGVGASAGPCCVPLAISVTSSTPCGAGSGRDKGVRVAAVQCRSPCVAQINTIAITPAQEPMSLMQNASAIQCTAAT